MTPPPAGSFRDAAASAQAHIPGTARLMLVIGLSLAAGLGLSPLYVLPSVIPASAPAVEFSGERALADLDVIAAEPHPMGSPEHAAVVDFIVGQLEAAGVSPEIQAATGWRDSSGQLHVGRVINILARIPGVHSTGAVLLTSHYDSMPTTPSAADGGAGVATILETVRAIQAGPPLKNDVIVFIGDADVNGVIGHMAFADHAWRQDVAVGFDFEGIGPDGPSVLVFDGQGLPNPDPNTEPAVPFPQNGWWLREALKVLPYPTLMLTLNSIPIGTSPDVMVVIWGIDAAGIGFAQFRGTEVYHTRLDTPARIDVRTLQHHGYNALTLTRHYGNLALDQASRPPRPNLIAFNVLPWRVVAYPQTWVLPLSVAVAALLMVVISVGVWRKRMGIGGLLLGFALLVLTVILAVAVSALAWKAGAALNPAYRVWMGRGYYGGDWRLLWLAALTLAVWSALLLFAGSRGDPGRRPNGLAAGALIGASGLAVLTGLAAPSFNYLFVWPALAGTLLLGSDVLIPAITQRPWVRLVLLALTGCVAIVPLMIPIVVVYTFTAAPWASATGAIPVVAATFGVVVLMAGALTPHLAFLGGQRRRWVVPVGLLALALVLWGGELTSTRFGATQPQPNHILYELDADTGQAAWISAATAPDAWTQQFFSQGYTHARAAFAPVYYYGQAFDVIQTPAPVVDLPVPRLETLADSMTGDVRTVRLRAVSDRGAPSINVELALPGEMTALIVDGQALRIARVTPEQRKRLALMFYNLPPEGIEIELTLEAAGPLCGTLTDYSNGLPEIPGLTVAPRPPEFMPAPYDFNDPTVVRASVAVGQCTPPRSESHHGRQPDGRIS